MIPMSCKRKGLGSARATAISGTAGVGGFHSLARAKCEVAIGDGTVFSWPLVGESSAKVCGWAGPGSGAKLQQLKAMATLAPMPRVMR